MTDNKVDAIKELIRVGYEWAEHTWDVDETWLPKKPLVDEEEVNVEEDAEIGDEVDEVRTPIAEDTSVSGFIRSKKRLPNHGAESRKQKLLCQRSAAKSVSLDEDMKTFLQGLIEASFVSMEERFGKKVEDHFVKLETQVLELRNEVANANILRNHVEPGSTSNPTRSDPSTAKGIQRRGKVENVAGKNTTLFDTLYDVPLSQTSDINPELSTQEILRKTLGFLSQDSLVSGFDPTQRLHVQDPTEWLTPKTSLKKEDTEVCDLLSKPSLIDNDRHERRKKEADYPLVFFTEESFEQVVSWSSTHTNYK